MWSPARPFSGAVVIALAAMACSGPPCRGHNDCEQGSYCDVARGALEGACARDCDALWSCPEGTFCTNRGQCQLESRAPELIVEEPAGAIEGEPGQTFLVRGRVRFLGAEATLRIEREDHAGCDAFRPYLLRLPGDRSKVIEFPFEIPAIALPDGGGLLRVEATVGDRHAVVERSLNSGLLCPDCPRLEILQPVSAQLEARSLFTWAAGRVDRVEPSAATWHVRTDDGQSLTLPFAQVGAELLLPLFLGHNTVALEASNAAGTRRCERWVDTTAPATDRLQVVLGWDSPEVDLDLHLIPPGGRYGPEDCSAAVSQSTRFAGCQVGADARAHGPEWALVPSSGPSGTYGILVVGFGGAGAAASGAYVRVLSHGTLIAALGPRDLSPARGEIWVVGTAAVGVHGAAAAFTPVDEILGYAPSHAPEDWPPY
ncbi:MAG: hypothetical protein ABIJ09_23045 [Pseudomonadota bacterium]